MFRLAPRVRTAPVSARLSLHTQPPPPPPTPKKDKKEKEPSSDKEPSKLQSLLNLDHILYDPIRIPRHPIVLCHGLYGFAVRGPSSFPRFQIHYWGKLLEILRSRLGVKVIVGKVPPTGTIEERAVELDKLLQSLPNTARRPPKYNFIAHSMGGLDARYLISHLNPQTYTPISLTTICTPHRGSPFMDWCRANIGVGLSATEASQKRVPFSLKEPLLRRPPEPLGYLPNNLLKVLLLNLLDSPAYSNLSTDYLTGEFNPRTPDRAGVEYFSIAAKIGKNGLSLIHPLWLPGLLIDRLVETHEQGNHDGLVTVQSAQWGRFLGTIVGTDHWEIRGSSAFGAEILPEQPADHDHLLNLHAKSNWLELNRYIGSWLSYSSSSDNSTNSQKLSKHNTSSKHSDSHSSSDSSDAALHKIFDQQTLSTRLLADWIAKKLPLNLYPSQPTLATSSSSSSSGSSFSTPHKNPSSSSLNTYSKYPFTNPTRTVHPQFPLDDLDLNHHQHNNNNNNHQKNSANGFDIEKFYLAVLRNLYDHGL
ncbi:hypothetical protein PGT21_024073 [Puccinia graminis f. sp. tritici]|uniref:DUF676 domain-containing protein n=1 Tax=Puccinia graminis f. sp. tritici TaxID=56615 RepID=A0A5B0PH24_PUCGR|nr:hypothetical protein PGT21_024073 [Puccinia graminis f. sp. tritici]KAA1123489.1 hypothetical protein PGTUg99_020063 [Puccinia graminis f. sp. tritici]